jgi:hypothetical protein
MAVQGWHEQALQDAGLRDMPLRCTRHIAAAAWLATGHPLVFVQRQLGHHSISTTRKHYVHLEVHFARCGRAERGEDPQGRTPGARCVGETAPRLVVGPDPRRVGTGRRLRYVQRRLVDAQITTTEPSTAMLGEDCDGADDTERLILVATDGHRAGARAPPGHRA